MSVPSLGVTLACRDDFDGLFSVATSDKQIVMDEAYHRLTNDTVLGDTEIANGWGEDVRKLLGSPMTRDDIAALGPRLGGVIQRSPMIEFADVIPRRTSADGAPLVLELAITGKASTGVPFDFVFTLSAATGLQVGAI